MYIHINVTELAERVICGNFAEFDTLTHPNRPIRLDDDAHTIAALSV